VPIRIYSKNAKSLNLSEEKACSKLITSGSIYSLYVECCTPDSTRKNRVFLIKDNGVVVGWSIIQQLKKSSGKRRFQFMIYIKRKYRRIGLGTKLYKRSKKYFELTDEQIKVFSTTNYNSLFFEKVRTNL
jgi:hypothetical protein